MPSDAQFDAAIERYRRAENELNAAGRSLRGIMASRQIAAKRTIFQVAAGPERLADIGYIQELVATSEGFTVAELIGPRRTDRIVIPRHMAMAIVRRIVHATAEETGQAFGGRDHGSVLYAEQAVAKYCETDPRYRAKFESLLRAATTGLTKVEASCG